MMLRKVLGLAAVFAVTLTIANTSFAKADPCCPGPCCPMPTALNENDLKATLFLPTLRLLEKAPTHNNEPISPYNDTTHV